MFGLLGAPSMDIPQGPHPRPRARRHHALLVDEHGVFARFYWESHFNLYNAVNVLIPAAGASFLARTTKPRGVGQSGPITNSSITLTKAGTIRPGSSRNSFHKKFAPPSNRSAHSVGPGRSEARWQKSDTIGTSPHFLWLIRITTSFPRKGKIWDRIRAVAEANDCVPHMLQILNAARRAKLRVFYAPHRRYRPGDYETWKYIAPIQKAGWMRRTFEYGTWGGEFRAEFEPKARRNCRHRALVLQRFRQHGFGFAAQETRHPSAHRRRSNRAYVHRSNGPLCRCSSATRSPWLRTRQRITRIRRCRLLWTSISRIMPAPL